jgi:3-methylcrotonyl-CoA carboxylase alpha subunit
LELNQVGSYRISSDTLNADVTLESASENALTLLVNGQRPKVRFVRNDDFIAIFTGEDTFTFDRVKLELAGEGAASGDNIISPMPGAVVSLNAKAGEKVSEGDKLITIEAMKMEHGLTAPRDGVISEVLVKLGDQVEDGALLIALEPIDE